MISKGFSEIIRPIWAIFGVKVWMYKLNPTFKMAAFTIKHNDVNIDI